MKSVKNIDEKNNQQDKPSFELLMEKFQFHNTSIHFHAEMAKRVGDAIRDEYPNEARDTGYFTDEFFNSQENKADEERTIVSDEPQTTEANAEGVS